MHVHANAAISIDGKLASRRREQLAISGPDDFARVDRLRTQVDAVLVGVGTVIADDPSLTTPVGETQPARVVVDSLGRTPLEARILDGRAPTYLLVSASIEDERKAALEDTGAIIVVTSTTEQVDLDEGLEELESNGIARLLAEGGGEVMYSLFERNLVDRLTLFVSPHIIGGREAPTLVDGDGFVDTFPLLELVEVTHLDAGLLCTYNVRGRSSSAEAINR